MAQNTNKSQKSELPDYEWWVGFKSIWELRDAANLYLGFDPEKGGTFYDFNELLKSHERGLILTDSETVWDVNTVILYFCCTDNHNSKVSWHEGIPY